jgi:type II secretory pathway pseudopilin PulG
VVSLVSVTLISAFAGPLLFRVVRQQVEIRNKDLILSAANNAQRALSDYLSGQADVDAVNRSISPLFANRPEIH